MTIWRVRPSIEALTTIHHQTMVEYLGIAFTGVGDDYLEARMPVDHRTVQPFRILHGGASAVLAETLGSCAAAYVINTDTHRCVGQSVEANHLRPATKGHVTGRASPVHLGRTSHVWTIDLRDDDRRLTCYARLTVAIVGADARLNVK